MSNKEWEQLFSDMIETHGLEGRSFTYGVALYKAMSGGWVGEDGESQLDELITRAYAQVYETLGNYRLNTTMRAWAELLDIATLDELARELVGEE